MATFDKDIVQEYGSLEAFAQADGCLKIYESDSNYHVVRQPADEAAILSSPYVKNPRLVWSRESSALKALNDAYLVRDDPELYKRVEVVWGPRISSESDWMNRDGVRASLTWRAYEVHRHGSQPYGSNSWALQLNEQSQLRGEAWTTRPAASALPGPVLSPGLALPADHGVRLDDDECRSPARPEAREPGPEQAIRPREARPSGRAREHHELLAQGEVLQGNVAPRA